MAAYDVNGRCEDCTFADAFGRSCQHGMLFPVMVLMAYGDVYKCPNFEKKTIEQISEQIAQREQRRKEKPCEEKILTKQRMSVQTRG